MKRTISILSLILAVMMLFAACSTGGGNKPATTAESTPASTTPASTAPTSTAPAEPPTELNVMLMGNQPADLALVVTEINKVLIPKINCTMKLTFINPGAYRQQQNLVCAGNEKVDLMLTSPTSYLSTVAQGGLQDIGPLLDKYGQGVKAALGDYIKGSKVNGKIYGVRPLSDLAGGVGLVIRKDVVDKYKIDLTVIKSYADIGKVLKIIKDNDPKAFPLTFSSQSDGMVQSDSQFFYDTLDDFFGVLPYGSGDTKIINLFETQYYSDMVKLMRDWYQKGYVMKDAATATEDQRQLVKAGKAMCYITPTKPGIDIQEGAGIGLPVYAQEYCKPTSSTFVVTLFQWVIPNGAKTPEKSVQLLNEMYTNAALENLLAWGIEGKHWEKKSDGTIGFPAGIDDKNSGYWINAPWMVGNMFLTRVWTGNQPDVWEKIKQMNQSATLSKAMGFSYDPSPVKTEVSAVSNAYEQYKKGLESGSVDSSKVLPQMLSKLKSSGIDKVIAEKQKQFDAWLKVNGN